MKLAELRVDAFTELLASDAPAPGGGSAAALEGGIGAALTAMVCELTAGKKQYAEHRGFILETQRKAEHLRARFVDVMDRDTQAFLAVSNAFAMPKTTETPFEMMELASQALELTVSLLGRFNESAASDLGVAALSLRSGIQGAWLNVLINIGSLKDRDLAESYRRQGETILEKALPLADRIYSTVLSSLLK